MTFVETRIKCLKSVIIKLVRIIILFLMNYVIIIAICGLASLVGHCVCVCVHYSADTVGGLA